MGLVFAIFLIGAFAAAVYIDSLKNLIGRGSGFSLPPRRRNPQAWFVSQGPWRPAIESPARAAPVGIGSMGGSAWREQRNEQARRRLERAMPAVFPRMVLTHALGRPFVPPLPRLAVESYWRAHPLRADRLARSLAALGGAPPGWRWRLSSAADDGLPRSFRAAPAPFREPAFRRGPGHCCVCGQPVYRFGWHRDLWGEGKPNRRAEWHACCVVAWKLWQAPDQHGALLRRLQRRRCGVTGKRLLRTAELDHRLPLFEVWRDHRETAWPALLRFWGVPNLQAVNRAAHVAKSAREAMERAGVRGRGVALAAPRGTQADEPSSAVLG